MWTTLRLWIANVWGLCVAFPAIPIALGLIVLFLIVWGQIGACNSRKEERKIDEIKSNITVANFETNVLQNQKENINAEVNNAQENKNTAVNNFNNSVQRDSNTFTGNAENKFCERFCDDSTCIEWRKTHQCR